MVELKKMGADISLNGSTAHISGVANLVGSSVIASDLRASASLYWQVWLERIELK